MGDVFHGDKTSAEVPSHGASEPKDGMVDTPKLELEPRALPLQQQKGLSQSRGQKSSCGTVVHLTSEAGETFWWLRSVAPPAEGLNLVASTHIRWFTTTCDPSSRGPYIHLPLVSMGTYTNGCMLTCSMHAHTHTRMHA